MYPTLGRSRSSGVKSIDRRSDDRARNIEGTSDAKSWLHLKRKSVAGDLIDILQFEQLGDSRPTSNTTAATDQSTTSTVTSKHSSKTNVRKPLRKCPSESHLVRLGSAASSTQTQIDGQHPLMQNYQRTLSMHLSKVKDRIVTKQRAMEQKTKQLKLRVRAQLSEIHARQTAVERLSNEYAQRYKTVAEIGNNKKILEERNAEQTNRYQKLENAVKQEQSRSKSLQLRLDQINKKIGSVFLDPHVQQDEVTIAKNATVKAFKELKTTTKRKQMHDTLVARLKRASFKADEDLKLLTDELERIQNQNGTGSPHVAKLTTREPNDESETLTAQVYEISNECVIMENELVKARRELKKLKELSDNPLKSVEPNDHKKHSSTDEAAKQLSIEKLEEERYELQNEFDKANETLLTLLEANRKLREKLAELNKPAPVSTPTEDTLNLHRKRLELIKLNKEINKLTKNMEMGVLKRDILVEKTLSDAIRPTQIETQTELLEKVVELRKQVKQASKDVDLSKRDEADLEKMLQHLKRYREETSLNQD